ncbi:MAG TPA: carboxypeptidase-like regulatory domain-containing protein, partial [Planctomycetota bacterium]|nr:carboxypeptidase-like regulatory domain-containing protein [Planctomycetota bacterium]
GEEPAAGSAVALRGRVRAPDGFAADGSPRWRAVEAFRVFALPAVPLPMAATPELFEVADPEGRFELPPLQVNDYTLFVVAPDSAVWRSQAMALGEAPDDPALVPVLDVRLDPGLRVSGTLRGPDGAPLSGAVVVSERDAPVGVLPLDRESFADEFAFVRHAVSDADGRYVLGHVARGTQVLRASGGGAGAAWLDDVEVAGAQPLAGVDFALPPAGSIGGRVLDADGAPRSGAVVLASAADFSRQRPTLSYAAAVVDAQGRYEIGGLPAGTLAVLLFADGTPDTSSTPDMRLVSVRAGARRELDFLARRAVARLQGTVLDAGGAPLAGMPVWIELAPDGGRPSSMVSATTDAAGVFRFEELRPGRLDVFVGGLRPTQLVLLERLELAAGEDLRRELRAGSERVAGIVRGSDGAPLSGALVVLLEGPERGFVGKSMCDATGAFDLPHVRPGLYDLHVYSARGPHGELVREGLAVAGGVGVEGLDLRLPPGGALQVEVRDRDGAIVPGAALRLFDAAGTERWCEDEFFGDGEARARVGGLGLGRWRVRVQAPGFAAGEAWAEVRPGSADTVRVVLERAQ